MRNRTKAMLLLVISSFFFALMTAFVKLAGDVPLAEKVFFRNIVTLILILVIAAAKKIPLRVPEKGQKYVAVRALAGTLAILCNFYAVDRLNLADANMLNKLSPFFAVIFSFLLLRERNTRRQLLAVVIAFIGALLIIKPSGSNLLLIPSLIGALGGALAGLAVTMVRGASEHGAPRAAIMLSFSLTSCVSVLPSIIADYTPLAATQLVPLLCCGVCGSVGQLAITTAYSCAPAREISVFSYAQPVFSTVFGLLFFAQLPDTLSFVGYAVIIGAGIFAFFSGGGEPQEAEEGS